MRADRHGIALILVVLALAGVFALVMNLALVSRSSQIESRVLIERLRDERDARSAAVLVLTGLGATVPTDARRSQSGGAEDEPITPKDPSEPEVQLPEIVRELLRAAGKLDEIEGGAEEVAEEVSEAQQRAQPSPGVGDANKRSVRFRALRDIGLPPEPVSVRIGEREYAVTIRDAIGGLNINTAPREQLLRYFEHKAVPFERAERLAEQIIHWRDPNASPPPGSAEQDHYRAMEIIPRDAELQSLEEVLYLPAMDRDLFERIRTDLVLTGDSVHAGSASEAVLRSVDGVSENMVEEIMALRESFRLGPEEFERLLPLADQDLDDRLRPEPLNFLEIVVERTSPPGPAYRGLASIGERRIIAFGLKLD